MAKLERLSMWANVVVADTVDLTHLEFSAYHHLLYAAWRTSDDATLPNDDRLLRKMARCTHAAWRTVRPAVLSRFWKLRDDGRLELQWLSDERIDAAERTSGAKRAARARWGRSMVLPFPRRRG